MAGQEGQDGAVTLYKEGRSMQFKNDPALLKAAGAKGWRPQSAPSGGGLQPLSFGQGFGQGINPFHQVPQGVEGQNKPGALKFAEDMFNAREVSTRIHQKDYKGAAGMEAGTIAGLLGPDFIGGAVKGARGAGAAGKAAEATALGRRLADRAKMTQREFGGSIEASRFAERYVAPLRKALDDRFGAIHDALNGKAFAISNRTEQLIRTLRKSEFPGVSKLGDDLARIAKNGAITYGEAKDLSEKTIPRLIKQLHSPTAKASHWLPEVEELGKEVEAGVQKLADQHGLGQARTEAKALYAQVKNLTGHIVESAPQKASTAKKIAAGTLGFGTGMLGGHEPLATTYAAMRAVEGSTLKLTDDALMHGMELANKLGVNFKEMLKANKGSKDLIPMLQKLVKATYGAGATARGALAPK
jgi:hypothetical protein